jgi:phosphoglucosamine mutase
MPVESPPSMTLTPSFASFTSPLFGTDGIRGLANTPPMTADLAMRVAMAAARQLHNGTHRHLVVIGKDTRLSGYLLEPALTAGFIAMGMDVVMTGPLPTPAVARLVRSMRADLGVMISASHNPYQDNGIKLFGPDGFKLSDDTERAIERDVTQDLSPFMAAPDRLGRASRMEDGAGRYVESVKADFPRGMRLDGLKIVVDCAHGAAYKVAPTVLWELGAEIVTLGTSPNGRNINDGCGATAPAALQTAVREAGADIGIALDGDADRVILVDELGQVVDGDQILALLAGEWQQRGILKGDGIVATVMSNLGLERCLQSRGVRLHRTPVGDRAVVGHMRQHGYNLGGEQSGHIILGDHGTTGDGLAAALQALAALIRAGKPASAVFCQFVPVPQKLHNIRGVDRQALQQPEVLAVIAAVEADLGTAGRVLVRPSGTEALIRIMIEAEEASQIDVMIERIAASLGVFGQGSHTHGAGGRVLAAS